MKATLSGETETTTTPPSNKYERLISTIAWLTALSLVVLVLFLSWRTLSGHSSNLRSFIDRDAPQISSPRPTAPLDQVDPPIEGRENIALPPTINTGPEAGNAINRSSNLHTTIPDRPQQEINHYIIELGDSVFGIAERFFVSPESVLWANYDQLNDNPHMISVGMKLNIPPVTGVLYTWQDGDTIESVASRFDANPEDILGWPGNDIDLVNQQVEPGSLVMVPGGEREFRQWIIPTIPRGRAGVSRSVYGSGACDGGYEGAYGDGAFIWPADNHTLSGNDYWSGHLGIDIAAGEGARIYAADNGVVVFAGWATGGYGNTVVIDHGNGYQTLYGHLSSVNVRCGQSTGKGSVIGYAGSTGNSTGAHLHFEIRYQGGFVNPWYVLPAP